MPWVSLRQLLLELLRHVHLLGEAMGRRRGGGRGGGGDQEQRGEDEAAGDHISGPAATIRAGRARRRGVPGARSRLLPAAAAGRPRVGETRGRDAREGGGGKGQHWDERAGGWLVLCFVVSPALSAGARQSAAGDAAMTATPQAPRPRHCLSSSSAGYS